MSTPRTSEVLNQLMEEKLEIHEGNCPEKLVKLARQLETELDAMTKERDRLRDVKWEGIAKIESELKAEREKVAKLEDIIRRASTKFCEDGPDGEIAAGMFRILGESREETK